MKDETIDPEVQMTAGNHQPELTAEEVEVVAAIKRFIQAKEREMHISRSTAARWGKREQNEIAMFYQASQP